jgi:hypothetical protein
MRSFHPFAMRFVVTAQVNPSALTAFPHAVALNPLREAGDVRRHRSRSSTSQLLSCHSTRLARSSPPGILRTVTTLEYSDSIDVSVPPDQVYAMVSDPTRMGEWSPVCKACWWDEGDGPSVGAWFTGRNVTPERTWESRCQVVAAEPGREFAWEVNNGWVRWGFTLEPRDGGTRLTESWAFLPAGLAGFRERWGDKAEAAVENRVEAAHTGIPVTLAAIKKAAEAS